MADPNLKGVHEVEMAARSRDSEATEVKGRPPATTNEIEAAAVPLR